MHAQICLMERGATTRPCSNHAILADPGRRFTLSVSHRRDPHAMKMSTTRPKAQASALSKEAQHRARSAPIDTHNSITRMRAVDELGYYQVLEEMMGQSKVPRDHVQRCSMAREVRERSRSELNRRSSNRIRTPSQVRRELWQFTSLMSIPLPP